MARSRKHDARREQLIDAASRAITERGRDNLRIRDIAAQAGVSPGSVLYHYPELDELMFDVHRNVVERFYQRRLATVESIETPVGKLAAALGSGLPSGRDDDVARVLYEMHGLADRSSTHASLMTSLYDREVALYSTVLEAGRASGAFTLTQPLGEVVHTLVVLEDGFGLHLLSNNTSVDLARARSLLTAYAGQATGCALPV
ncbi:TetR/AcrR family transcriptional regulator [Haloactinomyces albus]|uniref:AcrR family transcriptional regulator n=1 Tax=Haloactinomyces albus TaxID=1352928 RepID=A0AAE3ZH06_9ACTN|nr:TetR family transcriptional regulator [Haloactinomyces albus]MDR7303590.1 AcrR family transcriptional regulator [Haloactinomyces albus]